MEELTQEDISVGMKLGMIFMQNGKPFPTNYGQFVGHMTMIVALLNAAEDEKRPPTKEEVRDIFISLREGTRRLAKYAEQFYVSQN